MLQSKKTTVTKNCSQKRFDIACVELFPSLSRKQIKSIIDTGGAYLNKKRIHVAKYLVNAGDSIELCWNTTQKQNQQISFENIVFENENFLVLNKPAGIPVQGTLDSDKNTILHALNRFDKKKYLLDSLMLVHRLDKDTSGLMIIAKNKETQQKFEDLFREHKIQKTYHALCYFTPRKSEGTIVYPIAKDISRKNTYFSVTTNKKYPHQKSAETEYYLEKKYPHGAALVICKPKTGRTHQIRVHLSAIGCPIIGDKTYAQNVYGHPYARSATRHLLHASSLEFVFNGKDYSFTTNLPEDFNIKH